MGDVACRHVVDRRSEAPLVAHDVGSARGLITWSTEQSPPAGAAGVPILVPTGVDETKAVGRRLFSAERGIRWISPRPAGVIVVVDAAASAYPSWPKSLVQVKLYGQDVGSSSTGLEGDRTQTAPPTGKKLSSTSRVFCHSGASFGLSRSRRRRLVVVGMISTVYTVFVGPKPLLESDRGAWHHRIVQVVSNKAHLLLAGLLVDGQTSKSTAS
ncbi:hypothetical protein GGTG_06831 [Gaeumannomyces tritici R3-111a-1]|uniref:Uncharacterized protein n=1 Tax=Gaeumannomyces tritici (strain R3-111a-1) TaxID=644352 RepID=J3NZY4_GAET3|nr:hypothetical protein GGTG_06831 [Gaeumannomyces tritici R3-111a-1]EJT76917.1 hypothetical protein GGTG_06831 [Gaeumannomyces tritici R3-111a-1]